MIFPTATELADFPGLVPWLVEGTWRAEFESPALIRDHGIRVTMISLWKPSSP